MKAHDVYAYLEAEFGNDLEINRRQDGRAYFWPGKTDGKGSTRLIRISETSAGGVAEIKLAQSSLAAGHNVFLPLPASPEDVAAAVRHEMSGPRGQ